MATKRRYTEAELLEARASARSEGWDAGYQAALGKLGDIASDFGESEYMAQESSLLFWLQSKVEQLRHK